MEQFFRKLTDWICRHRRLVLAAWVVALALGAAGTFRLPGRLLAGSGSIEGSDSARMDQVLQAEFANPLSRMLVAVVHSPQFTVEDPAIRGVLAEMENTLASSPDVKAVVSWSQPGSSQLRSADGHGAMIMIGLKADSREDEERLVPVIRALVDPLGDKLREKDPGARVATVGPAAITYDLNRASQKDARHTEIWTLPITAVILLIAFGTPAAAGLPLIAGVTSMVVSWGMAFLLTLFMPLSNLIENIATMVGLAVGIDYALLTVSRYREELSRGDGSEGTDGGGDAVQGAITRTFGHTGPAILYSGLTVMIGLAGLVLTPLMETRSIGLGGAIVVLVSVAAAATFMPALLALLHRWLDRPQWMARPLVQSARARLRWEKIATWVMRHPWPVLAGSLIVLLLVARPVLRLNLGFPTGNWLPRSTQTGYGFDMVKQMGMRNSAFPIQMVVRTPDGSPILPAKIPELASLTSQIKNDRRVGRVVSPLLALQGGAAPSEGGPPGGLLGSLMSASNRLDWFLSRDRSAMLVQVFPAEGMQIDSILALASDLKSVTSPGLARPEIGGQAVYYNDIDRTVKSTYPMILAVVVGATLLVLFVAYRSILIPVKAVALNLLSVAAGCGVVVAVFQEGWCGSFVSLSEPLGAIPVYVPLVIFCIMFGLSMDYEVFLISRIKESFDRTGDNTRATAEGLAATGSIITQAALVMVAVFGASAWAEVVVVQMIGLGLAVTVLVDATLVRVLLVPAFMRLAGGWNWYPGRRRKLPAADEG